MKVAVLNGPNLDRLGARDPQTYGTATLGDLEAVCRQAAESLGIDLEFQQTNSEEELCGLIVRAGEEADGLVVNPAALSHWSLRVRDAISGLSIPVVEVHLSNIYAREPWRRRSVVSAQASGVVAGLGVKGYVVAIETVVEMNKEPR